MKNEELKIMNVELRIAIERETKNLRHCEGGRRTTEAISPGNIQMLNIQNRFNGCG